MNIETIKSDLKEAMKAKDSLKSSVLRSIMSAYTNELIASARKPTDTLDDKEFISLLKRLLKQRKESAEQFRAGGREDLAEKEDKEAEIISDYLPEQPSKEEIEKAAKEIIDEMPDAQTGQIIGAVIKKFNGLADGSLVKEIIEELKS